jgi:O-antigen ligase
MFRSQTVSLVGRVVNSSVASRAFGELSGPLRGHGGTRLVAALVAVLFAVAAGLVTTSLSTGRVLALCGVLVVGLLAAYSTSRLGGFVLVAAFALLTGLFTELSNPLYTPPIGLGGISIQYLDLLLLALAGVWLVRRRSLFDLRLPETLLVLFVGWTAFVGVVRSLYLDLTFDVWTRELRTIAYFAFPVLLLPVLNTRERVLMAGRLLLWTSVAVGAMALFVRLFHDSIPSQVNLLIYRDEYGVRVFQVFGVERATWGILFAVSLLLATSRRWLWLVIAANAITLVVALTRGSYVAVAVAIVVMALALGRPRPTRALFAVGALGLIIVGAAASLSWLSGEDVVTPFVGRVATLDQLATGEGTVSARMAEIRVVWSFLEERPEALVLGQGLGGTYTDPFNELTAEIVNLGDRRYAYVHNGFLWYVLRGGVVSMALLYGFCGVVIVRCLRRARQVDQPWLRGTLVGVAGVFVAVLTLSGSGAPLSEGLRMSVLMLYGGLGLAALRLADNPSAPTCAS